MCCTKHSHVRVFRVTCWACPSKCYSSHRDVAGSELDSECKCLSFHVILPVHLELEGRIGEGGHLSSRTCTGGSLLRKMFWGLPVEPENNLYHLGRHEHGQGRMKAVSWGCHNKAPQTTWLKEQKLLLTVLEAEAQNQGIRGPCSLWNLSGKPSLPPLSFWGFAGVFGVPWLVPASLQSSIFTWLHVCRPLCVSTFPFFIRTQA